MSGHSKWATIKHKKGAADKARGKLFAKLIRQVEVAAREGGGEALTGVCIGQPLSLENGFLFRVPTRSLTWKATRTDALDASVRTTRRGLRPWHVHTLLVREPGDLGFGRRCTAGPYREGRWP